MKRLSRRPKKLEKQKPTHLIALMEPAHGLGLHTIVQAWEYKVHDIRVSWRFNHQIRGVVDLLPYQIKVLKKITIKRTSNVKLAKASDRALPIPRSS